LVSNTWSQSSFGVSGAGGADRLSGLVERGLRAADREHGRALGGEALSDRAADARARRR
jgi:hypothetical protein